MINCIAVYKGDIVLYSHNYIDKVYIFRYNEDEKAFHNKEVGATYSLEEVMLDDDFIIIEDNL